MLTLLGRGQGNDCEGNTRRDFLRAGALTLGGLSLPWLLRTRAEAAAALGPEFVRDKAVVVMFLSGGASHIETFNPNMGAPAPYYSVTGEVKTPIPGVTFGGTFPLLARHAEKMTIVRSFRHPVGSHAQAIGHVLTGGTDPNGQGQTGHSMGSFYTRLRGANHPRTGLPTYALLQSEEVDGQYRKELGRVQKGSRPGPLGPSFAPFRPNGKGAALDNMKLQMPEGRVGDRRSLLQQIDRYKRDSDALGNMNGYDKFAEQAVDLLLGGASKAFDVSDEDPRLVERYDTSMFRVGKKVFRKADLGNHFLVARRLIEAGCGFVTIHSAGWDMHADGNNPGIDAGMRMLGAPLDKGMSAFIEDLDARGLLDKVLIVVTGDFGRTPKINGNGGRDHWANLCTLAFIGGGLNHGQVIGQADRNNGTPATKPITTENMMSTIMHTLFDVGQLRVTRSAPSNLVKRIEDHPPIEQLF